jgi:hypothetical protein
MPAHSSELTSKQLPCSGRPRNGSHAKAGSGNRCAGAGEAMPFTDAGSARLGSARLGSARLGSARLGSARLGSARLGSAVDGVVRAGSWQAQDTNLDPAIRPLARQSRSSRQASGLASPWLVQPQSSTVDDGPSPHCIPGFFGPTFHVKRRDRDQGSRASPDSLDVMGTNVGGDPSAVRGHLPSEADRSYGP